MIWNPRLSVASSLIIIPLSILRYVHRDQSCKLTTEHLLGSFPMTWVASVMVVAQDRKDSALLRGIGHESQLKSGHCFIGTVSCEAHSLLVQVVPAILITHN